MALVAHGQIALLSALFNRHHQYVYNFVHQMTRNREVSEDITQEVFYKILKYRESYNGGAFKTWMFTIARNCIATHFAKEKDIYAPLENAIKEADNKATDTDEHSELLQALAKLSISDREILILNRLQEIKYNELAILLNSTPNAVKTKVNRALQKLRDVYFKQVTL